MDLIIIMKKNVSFSNNIQTLIFIKYDNDNNKLWWTYQEYELMIVEAKLEVLYLIKDNILLSFKEAQQILYQLNNLEEF